jgi:hypothetical protein
MSGPVWNVRRREWRLDIAGALLGLSVAVLLFPLRYLSSQILVETVPLVLGGASGLYLVATRTERAAVPAEAWRLSSFGTHCLRAGTLVGLAAMVFVGTATGGRTVPFYAVAALCYALVFGQVFLAAEADLRPGLVVAQLLVAAVIVRWTALLTTPGLVGIDSWTHITTYASSIRTTGGLDGMADVKYVAAPLYHLFVVVAADAFGTSLRTALYLTLGLVMPLSIALLYVTARRLLAARWALFAVAIYGVADHVVRWGVHIIPTSLGLVFFAAVLYGIVTARETHRRGPAYALVFWFGLAVVVTHQISTFITLVFLGAGALVQGWWWVTDRADATLPRSDRTDRSVNFLGLFAVLSTITVVNWSVTPYGDGSFLTTMLDVFRRTLARSAGFLRLESATATASGPIPGSLVSVPPHVSVIDSLGFLLLLLVTLVGAFTLLRRDQLEPLPVAFVFGIGLMLVATLGMPLFGLNTLVPARWYAFMYVPMAVVAAFGVRFLAGALPRRAVLAGVVAFALVFPGAMLVEHKATPEDPVFDESYPRYAYTASELTAARTITEVHPADAPLSTDLPYRALFTRWQDRYTARLSVGEDGTIASDYVVYRRYQSTGAAAVMADGAAVNVRVPADSVCQPAKDTVYTIGSVRYCRPPVDRR